MVSDCIVPRASEAARPVIRTLGLTLLLDAL
jgi:hypothetical protein